MTDEVGLQLAGPTDLNSSALADWVELSVLAEGRQFLSPAKTLTLVEQSGGVANETDIGLAFSVLHDRSDLGLSRYPFLFTRLGIERRNTTPDAAYVFLLLLSSAVSHVVNVPASLLVSASPLLEQLVTASIRGMLGTKGSAVRFGWPPEPGRPAAFAEAIPWLAHQLNARPLQLRATAGDRADGGIDVVAWWRHDDHRVAGPIGAVQVTYDQDLRKKSIEIAASDLDRWIEIPPPVPMLATPFDLTADPDLFVELSVRAVLLDRWRIISGLDQERGLDAQLEEWITGAAKFPDLHAA